MKATEMLKLYNFKAFKNSRWLYIFTGLSIFITVLVSLIVPQISKSNELYMEDNVKRINGGDLRITLDYPSKAFNDEIDKLKNEGYKVKKVVTVNGFLKNESGKKTIGSIVLGENSLKDDEIILYRSIAENIKVGIGDSVNIEMPNKSKKAFKVKEIENIPYGVTKDAEVLGYGKVSCNVDQDIFKGQNSLIFIEGGDGESLKSRLKEVEPGTKDMYCSLSDSRDLINGKMNTQVATFSVITTMSYILSILSIVSTTFMVLLKRKKDLAILRLVNNSYKTVKKAMMLELGFIVGVPILLSGAASFWVAKGFLRINGIIDLCSVSEKLMIIGKGMVFNGIVFLVFLNVAMLYLKTITPLSVIREGSSNINKCIKKIVALTLIFMPMMLAIYAIYVGKMSAMVLSAVIIIFIILCLLIAFISLKLVSTIPFKNNLWVYGTRSIRKNISSVMLMTLSITLTLMFILIGFTLDKALKNSFNESVKAVLPYDHLIAGELGNKTEGVLKSNKSVEGYTKAYKFRGNVLNKIVNEKGIDINEIKEEEYGTRYSILEGDDLFKGDKDGVLITSRFKDFNKLNVGDVLDVESEFGEVYHYKIKGIYDSGKINGISVLKEYSGVGRAVCYYVKSKDNKWLDEIKDGYIISMDSLGQGFTSMISRFLGVFKALSLISIFSCILFNINIAYMSFMREEKDETIIKALGIGKRFLLKDKFMKVVGVSVISSVMGVGVFYIVMRLGMNMVFKGKAVMEPRITLVCSLLTLVLAFMALYVPFVTINRNRGYEILREE